MKVPQFLKLCAMLTSQQFIATSLGSDRSLISIWIKGKVKCRRTSSELEKLKTSVVDVYKEFPIIADEINKIQVELPRTTKFRLWRGRDRTAYCKKNL